MPDAVRALERDLREIFHTRLHTLVAYGLRAAEPSHADDLGHGHATAPRPTHTLAIVDALAVDDLRACAKRAAAWHDQGLATPLVLAAHELEDSLDAFPLEFGAIVADHVVVAGRNPFERLQVEAADVRRACEVQARSHLLHLRQGYVEARDNPDALAVLIVRSAAPFAALLAGVARLQGRAAHDAGAVGRYIEHTLGLLGGSASDVTALAGVKEMPAAEAARLFPAYLDAVERLVKFVDGWSAS